MDKEWIPIISAFVGGVVAISAGIVAGLFNRSNLKMQLKHQVEYDNKKLWLTKLEELHSLLTEYLIILDDFVIEIQKTQSLEPNQELKLQYIEHQKLVTKPTAKLVTMLSFYGEDISLEWQNINSSINLLLKYAVEAVKREKPIDLLYDQIELVQANIEQLTDKIDYQATALLKQ